MVDGRPVAQVPADDRGLAYGDGVFETLRMVTGTAPLWRGHMARLKRGCRRLVLPVPDAGRLADEVRALAGGDDCLIKVIVTRGGGRGYQPMVGAAARRIVMRLPLPSVPDDLYWRGWHLRWCRLRMADQPLLAGLKHLNRLEQVLARAEWRSPAIDEGLLCDRRDHVIGATSANVFVVRRGRLTTPRLDNSGVAGVARDWLLRRAGRWLPVQEAPMPRAMLEQADEVFLSNAVRGVMPVTRLGRQRFGIGPVTRRLADELAAKGIGCALASRDLVAPGHAGRGQGRDV